MARLFRDLAIKTGVLTGTVAANAVELPGVTVDATVGAYKLTVAASESQETKDRDLAVFKAAMEGTAVPSSAGGNRFL